MRWAHDVDAQDIHRLVVRRRLLVSAPAGADVARLTTLLRQAGGDDAVVIDERVARVLGISDACVNVPPIAERREDLSRLLSEARLRAEGGLQLGTAHILGDLRALHAYAWPGHLDEIDHVMRMIVALRATGSLRQAAAALGTGKSTIADRLHAIGVSVVPRGRAWG